MNTNTQYKNEVDNIKTILEGYFGRIGCELHYFKIGWYNEVVKDVFKFPLDYDTFACLVISTPSMFEKAFLPFVKSNNYEETKRDPLDECLNMHMNNARQHLTNFKIEVLKDYELLPNRRPKILMQPTAHVSGAAYYYQDKDVFNTHDEACPLHNITQDPSSQIPQLSKLHENNHISMQRHSTLTCACPRPWPDGKKMFGVCIHPEYGGWFAMRGVMIFHDVKDPGMKRNTPKDVVPNRNDRIELLKRFNGNWKDSAYRNIIRTKVQYSQLQINYFTTPPKHRKELLKEIQGQ